MDFFTILAIFKQGVTHGREGLNGPRFDSEVATRHLARQDCGENWPVITNSPTLIP